MIPCEEVPDRVIEFGVAEVSLKRRLAECEARRAFAALGLSAISYLAQLAFIRLIEEIGEG